MRKRHITALAILITWCAIVGMHVRREYFRPAGKRLVLGARSLAPGSHYFSVRMNEAAIGFATATLDTVDGGFRLSDDMVLDVPALGEFTRANAATRIMLDDSLSLRSFEFRLRSQLGPFAVSGTRTGAETLDLVVSAGGEPERSRVRIPPGATLDAAVALRLAASGSLVPGRSARLNVFDPSTLSDRTVDVRVTATATLIVPDSVGRSENGRWFAAGWDTIPVWRVEQKLGGVDIASWVDEDGMTVRAESPLGFTIERTAFELARQDLDDARADLSLADGYGVLIEGTAIASNIEPDSIEAMDRLRVRLSGVDLEGFDLEGGRQALRGDTLIVTREPLDPQAGAGYTLPYRGTGEPATELGATPLIQSSHPRILREARRATGYANDPAAAAFRLKTWIYHRLEKTISPGLPSALQVLEAGRGDCNEHTVLYVAMARAIGLPARTAVGLVHVQGRFYYHAWPEVWLADRWVAMDPTLNQAPADASHLRFLVGGLARQVELIRLFGRLELEVL